MNMCKVCGGPAYVGVNVVECMNPKCAPFDAMDCADMMQAPPPLPDKDHTGEWWHCDRLAHGSPERIWYAKHHSKCALGYPRPTREECFAAWSADHRNIIEEEPARRTFRALASAAPEAFSRWESSRGLFSGCVFCITDLGDWDAMVRSLWQETNR